MNLDQSLSDDQFFQYLLSNTKAAFLKSPIYQKQKADNGKQWNYSVCGTPIQKGKGILLGINWGADDNHAAQEQMPDGEDIKDYKFISRSAALLARHLQVDAGTPTFNYANLCFFRSKAEKDLEDQDYVLSLPLFEEYVRFIQPPWLLSLGLSNYNRLVAFGRLTDITIVQDSEQRFSGVRATLWGFPFYCVPHPNARVKNISREEIWRKLLVNGGLGD